jgi:hypothetical protein
MRLDAREKTRPRAVEANLHKLDNVLYEGAEGDGADFVTFAKKNRYIQADAFCGREGLISTAIPRFLQDSCR